jgi:nicotinamidase-related amidase
MENGKKEINYMKNKSALIIIDIQLGMFEGSEVLFKRKELLETIINLITKARFSKTPILFIQHNGEDDSPIYPNSSGWEIHPLIQLSENDIVIPKNHPDAFQNTELQGELESRGISKLVIAGLQTEYCIDTTCRRAYSLGYKVILIKDGHSTYDTEYLDAEKIIIHHNQVLSNWFVTLTAANDVQFIDDN